ncbi:hypothetical protein FNL37_1440 [Methylovorus glucosotrophus]|nr:hypothetical protein FNL37_1440 [Methylovorus glucosotrophus]
MHFSIMNYFKNLSSAILSYIENVPIANRAYYYGYRLIPFFTIAIYSPKVSNIFKVPRPFFCSAPNMITIHKKSHSKDSYYVFVFIVNLHFQY